MLSTSYKSALFNVVGAALILPVFFVISGSSVTLPESFYKVDGIAMPIGIIVLLLFRKKSSNLYELIFLILIAMYITVGYLEGFQRHLLTIQFFYFFVVLHILKNLTYSELYEINRALVYSLMAFILVHFLSIIFFSDGNYFGGTTNVFGFVIYQSHLTYPLVLSFGIAILCQYNNLPWSIKYIFIFLAACIIFLTLRRVGLVIYLFTLILFVPWHGKLFLTLSIFLSALFVLDVSYLIDKADRLFSILDSGKLSRSKAWADALDVWNQPLAAIFGNGQNNYAHNFFLQQLATHGTLIGAILILFALYLIFSSIYTAANFYKKLVYILVVIVVDFNLNANLTQFYYAGVLALFLAGARREAYIGRKI